MTFCLDSDINAYSVIFRSIISDGSFAVTTDLHRFCRAFCASLFCADVQRDKRPAQQGRHSRQHRRSRENCCLMAFPGTREGLWGHIAAQNGTCYAEFCNVLRQPLHHVPPEKAKREQLHRPLGMRVSCPFVHLGTECDDGRVESIYGILEAELATGEPYLLSKIIQQSIIAVAEESAGAMLVLVGKVRLRRSTGDAQMVQVAAQQSAGRCLSREGTRNRQTDRKSCSQGDSMY